ncbi:MAG: SIMPL domain-containing protein, partial [Proteobacteria bacterium]|nr:SIMPL domain-containing protein [Pseudomonadota bacterium]
IHKSAEEIAYTDVAEITLSIVTKSKNLAEAIEANNALRRSIAEDLVSSGVDAEAIRSSRYSASPQFGWFRSKPGSYEVVNTMAVTVDEQTEFMRVAEIPDIHDAVRFAGIEFEHSEKELFERKVRDAALEKVLREQRYFEDKLGLKLSAVSFRFTDVRPHRSGYYRAIEETAATGLLSSAPRAGTPAPAPTFDEVRYEAGVSVTFEVEKQ